VGRKPDHQRISGKHRTLRLLPFLANTQRWFSDAATFAKDLQIATYADAAPSPGGIQPLTFDPSPFIVKRGRYIVGGLNAGPIGVVYRRDVGGQFTR